MDCQMYTPAQVARVLMLSRSKTYALLARGEIPSVYIGRNRRVPQAAFHEYVQRLIAGM